MPETTAKYSLVHDAYGPGPFLAWLLAAYTLTYQLYFTSQRKSRRNNWVSDKDLAMVVAYPVFAAGHLIYQIIHYPGAKDKIWRGDLYEEAYRTPKADLEYALAVRAAGKVCTAGLAVNFGFHQLLVGKKWWKRMINVANFWLFLALEFSCWKSGWQSFLVGNVVHVFLTSMGLIVMPFNLVLWPLAMYHFSVEVPSFQSLAVENTFKVVVLLVSVLFFAFLLAVMGAAGYGAWFGLTRFVMPETAHPVTEVFQAMALVLGIGNVLLTWIEIRGRKKQEEGPDLARDPETEERRIGPALALGVVNMVAPVRHLWRRDRNSLDRGEMRTG